MNSTAVDDGAQQVLDDRLRGLTLTPCAAQGRPLRREDWVDAAFSVASAPAGTAGTPLTSIRLGMADEGLEVTIAEASNALTFPLGTADWLVSTPFDAYGEAVPVGASGGWADDDTLRMELIFLETPHRMDIVCSLPSHTAQAAWRHWPLDGGTLQTQHRPRPTAIAFPRS